MRVRPWPDTARSTLAYWTRCGGSGRRRECGGCTRGSCPTSGEQGWPGASTSSCEYPSSAEYMTLLGGKLRNYRPKERSEPGSQEEMHRS